MVKSKWAMVGILALLAVCSGTLGFIFGSMPKNLGVAYIDWSELGGKLPQYEVYPNMADEKTADISVTIPEGADISRYTTAALQAISDTEKACKLCVIKPEKVRITVTSGYMRRIFTFKIGSFESLVKGEITVKEFWLDSFQYGVPTEGMSSSLARKSKFEDAFAALDDSAVEIKTETLTLKLGGERVNWQQDVARTATSMYIAQKSTGLYIQTVVIICPVKDGHVTVKFNYKYFLDMMTGKLPFSEFEKRVYVDFQNP